MSDIFLNQAYQACLWLAEREISVPDEDRHGVWDLSDKRELQLDRKAIIEALGEGYFYDSLYHLRNLDLIDLSNSIDGPLAFDSGELIEESRFVTGGPRAVTGADHLEGQLNSEIDNLIYSNAIETSYLEQEGVVQRDQEKEEKAADSSEPVKDEKDPDLTEMMAEIMGGVQVLADRMEAVDKDAPEEAKEEAPLYIQAQIKAHHMLVDLLANTTSMASGYEVITSNIFDCLKLKRELETETSLPSTFWPDHPLPHYEHSMQHFGPGQNAYFQKQCDRKGIKFEPEIIKGKEYWLTNIRLDQGFEDWYLPKLRKEFPLPTKATLKPQGNKYLIQFGTDPEREIKANDGLKLIRWIIRSATTNNPETESGLSPEDYETLSSFDDITTEQQEDFAKSASKVSDGQMVKFIRKHRQKLYHQLKLYRLHKFRPKSMEHSDYTLEQTEKLLLIKSNFIRTNDSEKGLFLSRIVEQFVNSDELDECLSDDELKEAFARDLSQKEKDLNTQQKKIQQDLKRLKDICPHFCYHMGAVHKGQQQGLIITGEGFIYCPGSRIEWDLGFN